MATCKHRPLQEERSIGFGASIACDSFPPLEEEDRGDLRRQHLWTSLPPCFSFAKGGNLLSTDLARNLPIGNQLIWKWNKPYVCVDTRQRFDEGETYGT